MKLIELSKRGKNKGKFFVQVDDKNYEDLAKYRWSVARNIKNGREIFYARRREGNGHKYMHRQIMGITDSNIFCDHADGDGLNCQEYNLRVATRGQNGVNRKAHGVSKYLGVSLNGIRWVAQIHVNKKRKWLGTFDTEEAAAIAYDNAAKEFHKEFANLNFK